MNLYIDMLYAKSFCLTNYCEEFIKGSWIIPKSIGQAFRGFARTALNRRMLPQGHRKRGYEE